MMDNYDGVDIDRLPYVSVRGLPSGGCIGWQISKLGDKRCLWISTSKKREMTEYLGMYDRHE